MSRSPSSRLRLLTLLTCITLALTYNVAHAKPVSPEASGAAIEACLLEDDAQLRENSTKFACCSRAAGICVVCPKPPSAGNRCDVTAYRSAIPGMDRVVRPDSFDQQMRMN
jgi:hypothetical protein